MPKRTPERIQFLSDVLTTAVEGGINDWAAVTRYKWDGEHADYPIALIVDAEWDGEDDPDFPEQTITIDVIAKGIGVIKSWKKEKGFEPNYFGDGGAYWRQFLKANETNGDDGDYDAIIADWIVQAGLFGKIRYS